MCDNGVNDLVIKGIIFIRKGRHRPTLQAIFDFVKRENKTISEAEFKAAIVKLISEGMIFNNPSAGKKESFYINQTEYENSMESKTSKDTHAVSINNEENVTPTKSLKVNSDSKAYFTDPVLPAVNQRNMNKIDNFIQRRVIEEILPFTDKLESLLQSYDGLLEKHQNLIHTNNVLREQNQKLTMTEANVKRLDLEISFLRNEIKAKNELIKIICCNKDDMSPSQTHVGKENIYDDSLENGRTESVINRNENNTSRRQHANTWIKQKPQTTCIIGDSMIKTLKSKFIKKNVNKNEKVFINSFPGANIKKMHHYAVPSLEYDPERVVLHIGTNELRSQKLPNEIAIEILDLAGTIKKESNEIIISGIIPRRDFLNEKAKEVNSILKSLCNENNIVYVDNSNILPSKHLSNDNLHLNIYGTQTLTTNFSNVIRT